MNATPPNGDALTEGDNPKPRVGQRVVVIEDENPMVAERIASSMWKRAAALPPPVIHTKESNDAPRSPPHSGEALKRRR